MEESKSCFICLEPAKFACSCKTIYYCGQGCREKDWGRHGMTCTARVHRVGVAYTAIHDAFRNLTRTAVDLVKDALARNTLLQTASELEGVIPKHEIIRRPEDLSFIKNPALYDGITEDAGSKFDSMAKIKLYSELYQLIVIGIKMGCVSSTEQDLPTKAMETSIETIKNISITAVVTKEILIKIASRFDVIAGRVPYMGCSSPFFSVFAEAAKIFSKEFISQREDITEGTHVFAIVDAYIMNRIFTMLKYHYENTMAIRQFVLSIGRSRYVTKFPVTYEEVLDKYFDPNLLRGIVTLATASKLYELMCWIFGLAVSAESSFGIKFTVLDGIIGNRDGWSLSCMNMTLQFDYLARLFEYIRNTKLGMMSLPLLNEILRSATGGDLSVVTRYATDARLYTLGRVENDQKFDFSREPLIPVVRVDIDSAIFNKLANLSRELFADPKIIDIRSKLKPDTVINPRVIDIVAYNGYIAQNNILDLCTAIAYPIELLRSLSQDDINVARRVINHEIVKHINMIRWPTKYTIADIQYSFFGLYDTYRTTTLAPEHQNNQIMKDFIAVGTEAARMLSGRAPVTTIPVLSWFSRITGVDENAFSATKKNLIAQVQKFSIPGTSETAPTLAIQRQIPSAESFQAGTFYVTDIGSMWNRFMSSPDVAAIERCTLEILIRRDNESTRWVDVAAIQAETYNRGAMFQVASNFSCVESASEDSAPDEREFTTAYPWDQTQGPTASVGAGAAAITRVHAAFYNETRDPSTWQQTATHQIDLLSNLKKYFTTKNGYVTNIGSEEPIPTDENGYWSTLFNTKIGIHRDVEITSGARIKESQIIDGTKKIFPMFEITNTKHQINQVFAAAMNMQQGSSGRINASLHGAHDKAKLLLGAAYMGTYLSAIECKSSTLYLTLIGGGAFGNNFNLIFEQILSAHSIVALSPKNGVIKRVRLVMYSVPEDGSFEIFLNSLSSDIPHRIIEFRNNQRIVIKDTTL